MWNNLTRSLRNPNYRRYFAGQLISLHGTQMANVAQSWLVYSMTQSSFMLGLVHFTLLLPVLLFGLFGGVEKNRKKTTTKNKKQKQRKKTT